MPDSCFLNIPKETKNKTLSLQICSSLPHLNELYLYSSRCAEGQASESWSLSHPIVSKSNQLYHQNRPESGHFLPPPSIPPRPDDHPSNYCNSVLTGFHTSVLVPRIRSSQSLPATPSFICLKSAHFPTLPNYLSKSLCTGPSPSLQQPHWSPSRTCCVPSHLPKALDSLFTAWSVLP